MSEKLRRPRIVNVMGQKFTIKYVDPDQEELCEGEAYGCTHLSKRLIYIDNTLGRDEMRRVLIHEITHAILGVAGISEKIPLPVEEALATLMESAVYTYRVVNRLHG